MVERGYDGKRSWHFWMGGVLIAKVTSWSAGSDGVARVDVVARKMEEMATTHEVSFNDDAPLNGEHRVTLYRIKKRK